MLKKIKKWGNSLAIRIPKGEAKKLNLYKDKDVEIKTKGDYLIIKPKEDKLGKMIKGINEKNLHRKGFPEDTPKGREIW